MIDEISLVTFDSIVVIPAINFLINSRKKYAIPGGNGGEI